MRHIRRANEPHDRLTGIADDLLTALSEHPEREGVRAIIMLSDDERSGTALEGWEDDVEAMAFMFMHLQAIMRANGKEMRIIALGEG